MKSFDNYITDWFANFLEEHEDTDDFFQTLFYEMGYVFDDLSGDKTHLDFLSNISSDDIYEKLITANVSVEDAPDHQTFLKNMFLEVVPNKELTFVDSFVEDMAYHAQDYSSPLGFFQDLTHGCQSGMIGMLIYNSDCKDIYIEHCVDMESFKEEIEEELGSFIQNKSGVPHYTFLCWFCYEELGFQIARNLFENHF